MTEPRWPLRPVGEKVALDEMIFLCNDEAERIAGIQTARDNAGDGKDLGQLRRSEVFAATARFLVDQIEPYKDEIRDFIARKRKGARR